MKYRICNIVVEIEDIPIIPIENYNKYRIDDDSVADVHIYVEEVDSIELPSERCLYQYGHGLHVFFKDGTEYRYLLNHGTKQVDKVFVNDGKTFRLKVLKDTNVYSLSEMVLFNAIGLESIYSTMGCMFLHCSFIETRHGAVLFSAPSQTGKSTQANLWNKHRNTLIVNGDRAGIWKSEAGWMAGGIPWCGTSGISENRQIPLLAIVVLKQGPTNQVEPMNLVAKIGRLMEQTTINPWNRVMYQKIQELYIDLCQEVPVLQLSCRPDEEAVDVLELELKKYYDEDGFRTDSFR